MSTRNIMIRRVVFMGVLFFVGLPLTRGEAQFPPLLKARLKIEGVHKRSSVDAINQALLSIPGVKKVEWTIPKRWVVFRDYKHAQVIVEFEQGRLTSETIIQTVEGISKPKRIYKVKFLE